MKIIVWNAQDWRPSQKDTEAQYARHGIVHFLLEERKPDLLVLLETGTAGNPVPAVNFDHYGSAAAPYDAFSGPTDKGIMYLWSLTLQKPSVEYSILAPSERRSTVKLNMAGHKFHFVHQIAASGAAAQQAIALWETDWKDAELVAGDMNFLPAAPPLGFRANFELVSSGGPTHHTRATGNLKELDWGYGLKCRHWTASRLDYAYGMPIWHGIDASGVSDHAAMLYESSP